MQRPTERRYKDLLARLFAFAKEQGVESTDALTVPASLDIMLCDFINVLYWEGEALHVAAAALAAAG